MNYEPLFIKTYQDKKVFLTGHTGFKGSWLLTWLHSLGAIVKGLALAPENKTDLYNSIQGDRLCESVICDIRNRERLLQEVKAFEPDFIFHLAAQPLVRLSYEIPVDTFEVNVIGTANLLESVRMLRNKCCIINITTDKVYHNNEWVYPYRETDPLGGYDPYSASKAAMELIVASYRNSFFNADQYATHLKSIATARAGNVIGGGDWAKDRIIPDVIRAIENNKPVQIRNPHSVRPWQHVIEPLSGYLLLGARMNDQPVKFSGAFNFGPHIGDTIEVLELAQLAIQSMGKGSLSEESNTDGRHEAQLLKLDINKAFTELGWKPKFTARVAIEKTIRWYKKYLDNPDSALQMLQNDIKLYSTHA